MIKWVNCSLLSEDDQRGYVFISDRKIEKRFVASLNRKIYYRPDSIGDNGVIKQMFFEHQYDLKSVPQGRLVESMIEKMRELGVFYGIIDVGANIGLSSLWFLKKYNGSKVVAIEPDKDNFRLLKMNCAGASVLALNGGLADKKRKLYVQDPGLSDWGFRLEGKGEKLVECLGMKEVLKIGIEKKIYPLILKIDIEGGEELVFSSDCSWMRFVPVIIIELHDWLFPDRHTSYNFMKAVVKYKFQVYCRGENLFCFNKNLKKDVDYWIEQWSGFLEGDKV